MVPRVHLEVVAKTEMPHPLLVLLQSTASHVSDRIIPALCGQNEDIVSGSGQEHLNFCQTCIWNRHENCHVTFQINIIVINLTYI
jgi:hypothetical protein